MAKIKFIGVGKSDDNFWSLVTSLWIHECSEWKSIQLSDCVIKYLVLPFSNAEVERVFSWTNFLRTKLRNMWMLLVPPSIQNRPGILTFNPAFWKGQQILP